MNPVVLTLREQVKHLDFGFDEGGWTVCATGCNPDGVIELDSTDIEGVELLIFPLFENLEILVDIRV